MVSQSLSLTEQLVSAVASPARKKGYQDDELWTAVNPLTGKRQIVDPEGEFIPGETIIKLYYWQRIDGYVTIPGDSLFKVAADGYTLKPVG